MQWFSERVVSDLLLHEPNQIYSHAISPVIDVLNDVRKKSLHRSQECFIHYDVFSASVKEREAKNILSALMVGSGRSKKPLSPA